MTARGPWFAAVRAALSEHGPGVLFETNDLTFEPSDLALLLDIAEAAQAHVVARRDRLPTEWPRLLDALSRVPNSHTEAQQ